MNWKGCERKRLWLNLKYYTGIWLRTMRQITNIPQWDQSASRLRLKPSFSRVQDKSFTDWATFLLPKLKLNSVTWVRERTIPTERLPLVVEVSANICRERVSLQSSWLQIQRSGFDPRHYQIFWEVVGLERGPISLVSSIGEVLERKSSGSGLESREYGRRDPSR
jgi:hypothetical protein